MIDPGRGPPCSDCRGWVRGTHTPVPETPNPQPCTGAACRPAADRLTSMYLVLSKLAQVAREALGAWTVGQGP